MLESSSYRISMRDFFALAGLEDKIFEAGLRIETLDEFRLGEYEASRVFVFLDLFL